MDHDVGKLKSCLRSAVKENRKPQPRLGALLNIHKNGAHLLLFATESSSSLGQSKGISRPCKHDRNLYRVGLRGAYRTGSLVEVYVQFTKI
eukprot:scaffold2851_cov40-Attheya_sp.AAC.2